MTALAAGFVLGLAGSGHCVAMCGPLVIAVDRSLRRPARLTALRRSVTYHAGRSLTYALSGALVGTVGQTLTLMGFGRVLAVTAGLVLLLTAVGTGRGRLPRRLERLAARLGTRACGRAARWSEAHPVAGPLVGGAAHGLLPCGLVYAGLLAAAATGTAVQGAVFMAGFGLGTIPALLAVSLAGATLGMRARQPLRRLTPIALALTGALLLARGLAPPPSSPGPMHHVDGPVFGH